MYGNGSIKKYYHTTALLYSVIGYEILPQTFLHTPLSYIPLNLMEIILILLCKEYAGFI